MRLKEILRIIINYIMSIKLSALKSFDVSLIIQQMIKTYGWNKLYVELVAEEYIKFIIIRSNIPNTSPSADIDTFWHQHLLNTEHYYNFCLNNFNTFIHHDPEDANDRLAQSVRLQNTIDAYNKIFVSNNYNIWSHNVLLSRSSNSIGLTGAIGSTGMTGATGCAMNSSSIHNIMPKYPIGPTGLTGPTGCAGTLNFSEVQCFENSEKTF